MSRTTTNLAKKEKNKATERKTKPKEFIGALADIHPPTAQVDEPPTAAAKGKPGKAAQAKARARGG